MNPKKNLLQNKMIMTTASVPQIVHNNTLDMILMRDYISESQVFRILKEFRTPTRFLKIIFKTIELRHDLVYNDILAKTFNGVKTFITMNTQMHVIYKKVTKAKPLSVFKVKFRYIKALSPKLKEFYNLSGASTGYKIFQFFDNEKYKFANALKTYSQSRKAIFNTMVMALTTLQTKPKKSVIVSQPYRRRRYRLRMYGFRFKLNRNQHRVKYRKNTVFNSKMLFGSTLRKKNKKALRIAATLIKDYNA